MQISLFPETKQLEGHVESEVYWSVTPKWVIGRIDKKKGNGTTIRPSLTGDRKVNRQLLTAPSADDSQPSPN